MFGDMCERSWSSWWLSHTCLYLLGSSHILSCFSGYSFISHQLSFFQIFQILYFFKYVHCFLHFTTCIKKWNQRTPLVYPLFFQTNLWGLSLRLNAGLKTWSDFWKRVFNLHNLDNGRHGVPWWTAVGQGCWLEMGYLIKRWTPTYLTFIDISYNTRFFEIHMCWTLYFFLWYIEYACIYPILQKKGACIISWSWHWS